MNKKIAVLILMVVAAVFITIPVISISKSVKLRKHVSRRKVLFRKDRLKKDYPQLQSHSIQLRGPRSLPKHQNAILFLQVKK